jgi:putative transposase
MSRTARGDVEAGEYHVCTKSPGKTPFFLDDFDRTDFCNRLHRVIEKYRWRCLAFALLTNHFHLHLQVEDNALQPGMKALNGPYSQAFNRRHERWGHLCGSRYSLVPVESERQRARLFRYIALNPVKAGLAVRPQDWPWSSYAGTAGYATPFAFVTDAPIRELFGRGEEGRELLRVFVEEAVTDP